jgi:hypothetical protein
MIRIDELYCNTFLPGLQQRPNHGLHWFDPFGSVKYEDICSVPPVVNNTKAVRYLFLDQEPISGPVVEDTLQKFTALFSEGERHLITSEFQSENTEHIVNTYGFKPHYYFFHGWAALDWFRGYNRSFLMPPPEQRTITRTFIAPNRIVAGERQHRLYMLYHIFKQEMTDNWVSCPEVCPGENIKLLDAVKPLARAYPDIEQVFARQSLPINFPNETGHPMNSAWLNLFNESADSLLYLVTETVATGRRQHLTEKTFKPIALRMPFVVVGCAGSLRYLRSYGFKTFSDIWDESYDDEINDLQRYEKIAWTLQGLHNTSQAEKQRLFNSAREICEYNYNHFYNGGFEAILWDELTSMIDGL